MWLYCLGQNQTIAVADGTVAVVVAAGAAADVADVVAAGAADAVGLQHMLPNTLWRRPIFSVSKIAATIRKQKKRPRQQ